MTTYALTYSFPNLELVHCFVSNSNCLFLTCIQISQEAGMVVWYSHLFQNFPQFVVIHTVKGFGIVNEAEVNVFWNPLAFSMIQQMLAIWSLVPVPFLNPAWTSGISQFTYYWSLVRRILGEGNGTPLQYSCLENPIDGGDWWATVHGVARSQTRLSDFTFTFPLPRQLSPSPITQPCCPEGPDSPGEDLSERELEGQP